MTCAKSADQGNGAARGRWRAVNDHVLHRQLDFVGIRCAKQRAVGPQRGIATTLADGALQFVVVIHPIAELKRSGQTRDQDARGESELEHRISAFRTPPMSFHSTNLTVLAPFARFPSGTSAGPI